jgi:hypothetical protein
MRVVVIQVPNAVVSYDAPNRPDVVWVERPPDPRRWVAFEVLAEAPSAESREAEWSRGTVILGRVPRVDGGSLVVAAWAMHGRDETLTLKGQEGARERVRSAIADGDVRALVHGTNDDGSVWFLELRAESAGEEGASSPPRHPN